MAGIITATTISILAVASIRSKGRIDEKLVQERKEEMYMKFMDSGFHHY